MTAPAPAPQTAPAKKSPVNQLNEVLNNGAIKKQFENALQQNASTFMAAVLELFSTDGKLQLSVWPFCACLSTRLSDRLSS